VNILYLISCFGHGRGGHFYSLKTISDEMSKAHKVWISSVGTSTSPIFCDYKNYYPLKSKIPSPGMISDLIHLVKQKNINIIHSFDDISYFFARIVSRLTNIPDLLTKCGGPSPKHFYPKAGNLILFSTEDMRYFKKSTKHRAANLYHIPNRVTAAEQDWSAIQKIREGLRSDATIILRIARFCKLHKKSIVDSIRLVNRLVKDGLNVQLIIIGSKDQRVYNELLSYESENILIFTDDYYTVNASRLIGVAGIVVGTGRGAMEAAIQDRVLLSPVNGLSFPVLVTEKNIDSFLAYNFSARTQIRNISEEEEYENVKKAIDNNANFLNAQRFVRQCSRENFDVSVVRQKYENIYLKCVSCKVEVSDTIIHSYYVAKSFFGSSFRKKIN